jgi:hypothetical protein
MAYADKMHFTKSEYIEIKKLWLKTRKKQIRELGFEIYMYPFSCLEKYLEVDGKTDFDKYEYKYDPSESDLDIDGFTDDGEEYTVFNVSTKVELWLLKNFNLDCIKREVGKQLGEYWYQSIPKELQFDFVNDLNFSIKDRLLSIRNKKDISLYFYRNLEKPNIEPLDKMLIYGTADVYNVINDAINQIQGLNYARKPYYEIMFTFCGLLLVCNKKGIFYENKEILIPFMEPDFKIPSIKHSYNLKDVEKYKQDEIVISYSDKNIVNLVLYKGNPTVKRVLMHLKNDFLRSQIK